MDREPGPKTSPSKRVTTLEADADDWHKSKSASRRLKTATYSSAAYRRFAPIGGYLYKKLLDLFWQKSNILRKKRKLNFKIIIAG
jgi:hypothetical protein